MDQQPSRDRAATIPILGNGWWKAEHGKGDQTAPYPLSGMGVGER